MGLRILMFAIGMILTAFSVALFFKTYFYPQVYDFFVKAISQKYKFKISVVKTCVDISCLITSVIMTLTFFGKFVGINWGTAVMAIFNGTIIGFFSKMLDKFFVIEPLMKKFSALFDLE